MLKRKEVVKPKSTPYATSADFCRIFYDDMNNLYVLSLLLTADDKKAEECFVRALENSAGGTSVFKEWAHCWARRTIIHNAIRVCQPRSTDENFIPNPASSRGAAGIPAGIPAKIAAIVDLPVFERFAFVLSVLEHLSDHECSLLLSCARREVITARSRVLQRIANLVEFDHNQVTLTTSQQAGLIRT
jgi:DNA-directed RNA polymerase specialized sigma24 family protein